LRAEKVTCASLFVQEAGRVALTREDDHLDRVRETYRERRDFLVDAVADWGHGLDLGYTPGGAYYLLVDVSELGDAFDVADRLLDEAGVATTPGVDFGPAAADYLRLSYATSMDRLREADRRISAWLADV
jgi:aspartate/methionine/tyrosine aminotransferase